MGDFSWNIISGLEPLRKSGTCLYISHYMSVQKYQLYIYKKKITLFPPQMLQVIMPNIFTEAVTSKTGCLQMS